MKRSALLAAAVALAWAGLQAPAGAQSPSVGNPYIALQPGLTGYAMSGSIRDPNAGSLAPQWLDSTSITDPKAGIVTPSGFAKYSSLSSAISSEPVVREPSGPLEYTLSPPPAPVPTQYNSYGTPLSPYTAPTNAYSTPYTTYNDPYVIRPAPAAFGSTQVPSAAAPAREAAEEIASGTYLPRPTSGSSRRGSNR
jgi:hypothetical protein